MIKNNMEVDSGPVEEFQVLSKTVHQDKTQDLL